MSDVSIAITLIVNLIVGLMVLSIFGLIIYRFFEFIFDLYRDSPVTKIIKKYFGLLTKSKAVYDKDYVVKMELFTHTIRNALLLYDQEEGKMESACATLLNIKRALLNLNKDLLTPTAREEQILNEYMRKEREKQKKDNGDY